MLEIVKILRGLPQVQLILVSILPVLFAITLHEVAHGWVASLLGDQTAKRLGRLSLNPIKHIDPVGTVLLPMVLILLKSNILFGWAKPVPVTWENLRRPKRDMVLVAAAGPGSNFVMAFFWALMAQLGIALNTWGMAFGEPMYYMGLVGILINVLLMVFNLLPLPPLDGGRVAVGLLPGKLSWQLSRLEPWGIWIIVALLFSGLLWDVLLPIADAAVFVIAKLTGL